MPILTTSSGIKLYWIKAENAVGPPQRRWGKTGSGPVVVRQLLTTTLPCKHLEALPVNELLSQMKQCTVQLGLWHDCSNPELAINCFFIQPNLEKGRQAVV